MLALLRNRFVWIGLVLVAVVLGGGLFMQGQAKAKKAEEAKAAASAKPSPYAAIANGKADVEGGLIQVAARRAGVVRDVLVQEGEVVAKNQVGARREGLRWGRRRARPRRRARGRAPPRR